MPPAETKLSFKASIPPALQDLLVRDAAFGLSRKKIGDAVEVARQTRDAIAVAKPALSFIRQDAKRQHREKLQEAEESLAILEAGARELDVSIPTLRACVDRSLENYLREYDPEYVTGLAAARFYTDWQRILTRFDQGVEQYLGLLGKLSTTLEALVPNEVCGAHFDGRDLIQKAAQRARAVLDEISFMNKIADAQKGRAGASSSGIVRQRERKWHGLLNSFLTMPPLGAAKLVKGLQNDSMEVIEVVRTGIMEQCRLAKYAGGYGVASYHEHTWNAWTDEARLRIPPDELERIVAETADQIQAGKLVEWIPVRVDPPVDAAPAPAPPGSSAGRPNAIPFPAGAAPAPAPAPAVPVAAPAPPPPPPEPPVVIPVKSLSLRRSGSPPAATPPAPAQAAASVASAPSAATASAAPPQDAATLAEMKAERERLEGLLNETKASLVEREQFLSESEARLMQTSQAQVEREAELEQREEQLRELEKRLRELQPGLLPVEKAPEKKYDEFNE